MNWEISLEDARKVNKNLQLDDFVNEEVDFTTFDRAAVVLAKNVMKQKIREAEKAQVYEEYCDKLDEMVLGVVETVEEKFVIVNIGKTLAMLKNHNKFQLKNTMKDRNCWLSLQKSTKKQKGAQVLVSRATPVLYVAYLKEKFLRSIMEL